MKKTNTDYLPDFATFQEEGRCGWGADGSAEGPDQKRLTISFEESPSRSHFPESGASVAFDTFVAVLPEEQQKCEETCKSTLPKLRKCNATASSNGQ